MSRIVPGGRKQRNLRLHQRRKPLTTAIIVTAPKATPTTIRPDIHRRFLAILARANGRALREEQHILDIPVPGKYEWGGVDPVLEHE